MEPNTASPGCPIAVGEDAPSSVSLSEESGVTDTPSTAEKAADNSDKVCHNLIYRLTLLKHVLQGSNSFHDEKKLVSCTIFGITPTVQVKLHVNENFVLRL